MWLVFILVSLVILPSAFALILVRHLAEVCAALSFSQFVAPVAVSAGWGVAQILFGLSVARLGLGIAYAIIVGLGAVLGTLAPLFVEHSSAGTPGFLALLLCGVLLMILGIVVTTWGGHLRDQTKERKVTVRDKRLSGRNFSCGALRSYGANAELLIHIWTGHCPGSRCGWKLPLHGRIIGLADRSRWRIPSKRA